MKSKILFVAVLLVCFVSQAFADIVTFQTDTADKIMPLVDRAVLGLIASSIILGLSFIIGSHLSRKK